MLKITFEDCDGEHFAHIESSSGVLGHAAEVRDAIPSGTWLTMPSKLARLTPWMVKKCGFKFKARVFHNGEIVEILQKE